MRIVAFVHPRRTVGRVTGVGKFIANAPLAVARLGHDVRVLTPSDDIIDGSPLTCLPRAILPYRRRTIEWGGTIFGRPRISVDADWLWCPAESFVAVRGARLAITAHTSDWVESNLPWAKEWRYRKLRARWRLFYRAVRQSGALVLTVSQFLKRRLVDKVGLSEHRVCVVGHGVEDIYYKKPIGGLPESIDERQPYVLVTGGLSHYKGGDRVVKVAKQMPSVRFAVIDDAARDWSLPKNLVLLGYRDVNTDLPTIYANAGAVLILSRYETFGVPAAEAMAAGVPVIVSDAGALPEVVADGGCVVDGDDDAAIVGVLADILGDSAGRSQRIASGRVRAEDFRWSCTGQRIVDALGAGS